MQLSIFTLVTIVAAVMAGPIKRQVDPSQPSMTNSNGDVVPFDAKDVFQANKEKGL
ncbi:hypothetical protein BGZ63DRAFT_423604 [Mariannaea sp. PMI_226]|nr:hypothetical protein BGZ63DRAFT_423604 [Mariannaea sp. PMI_226]